MENSMVLEEDYKAKNTKATLKRLFKDMWKQKWRLIIVILSVLLYTVFTVLAPMYSARVVDLIWTKIQAAWQLGESFVITWTDGGMQILILLILYLASSGFYTLQNMLMASFAEKLNLQLRAQISEKLNRLTLSYYDRHQAGEIMSRVTNDLEKMSEALQMGLLKLFVAIGTAVGSIVCMFCYSWLLTLIFLGFTLISLIVTKVFSKKTLNIASARQQSMSDLTGLIEESYSGRAIIKAFNQEENSSKNVHEANKKLADISCKADFVTNAINPAIRLINRIGQVLIAIFGGLMLIDGRMSPGKFQAFFQYVNQAGEPITEMSYMITTMQSAIASVERVFAFLDEEELSPDTPKAVVKNAKGEIEFKNVRFGYTPDKILMKDISFVAKDGQKIAIVGSTGAGKTTMINLLMRFYEVNSGDIYLDGVKTTDLSRANLRENFGMVLQDTWLFEGSIADNIAYGKPDATREEIIKAAKAARADFFIRTMPNGYDTVLSNDAENISIGQRQLLTIARVVLCNPAVLILDEATSSVDTRTEIEIGKAMNNLMKNRTSFVIAHRLSTIVDADLILVIANGDIIEQGTHEELLKANGVYADLYNSQFA